jgi:hypothetical protein
MLPENLEVFQVLKRSREPAGVCSPEVGQAREGEGIVEE